MLFTVHCFNETVPKKEFPAASFVQGEGQSRDPRAHGNGNKSNDCSSRAVARQIARISAWKQVAVSDISKVPSVIAARYVSPVRARGCATFDVLRYTRNASKYTPSLAFFHYPTLPSGLQLING